MIIIEKNDYNTMPVGQVIKFGSVVKWLKALFTLSGVTELIIPLFTKNKEAK